MRRRQQQLREEQLSSSSTDIESPSKRNSSSSMIKSPASKPMDIATSMEVESGAIDDGYSKPFSLVPRNFDQRRKLLFVTFFLLVVWIFHPKGRSDYESIPLLFFSFPK